MCQCWNILGFYLFQTIQTHQWMTREIFIFDMDSFKIVKSKLFK
jgi:hypothetical protein